MRCTKCSERVKPIICIDIDGTLGDYHTHLILFTLKYLSLGNFHVLSEYDGRQSYKEWFTEEFDVDERTFRDIKLAYRQGAQKRSMPCEEWASWLTLELADEAEIWLTTTRPYLRHDSVDPDTRFWLENNNIHYDYLIYDDDKYKRLFEIVGPGRVVAVLDDLDEELRHAEAYFGRSACILQRNGFNSWWWDKWLSINEPGELLAALRHRCAEWRIQSDAQRDPAGVD